MENKINEISIPDFIPEIIKDKYKEIATRLAELELLDKIDLPAFDMMMFHYGLAVDSMKAIKEFGTFQKDRHILRKNPGIQIFRDNSKEFLKYAGILGLFPEERELLIAEIKRLRKHNELKS